MEDQLITFEIAKLAKEKGVQKYMLTNYEAMNPQNR